MAELNHLPANVAEVDTPALLIDLDLLKRNIARMTRRIIDAAGLQWRPHTKALKSPLLAHMVIRAGAHGVTCAKITEAEVMVQGGINNILVANQVVTPTKIERLMGLLRLADVLVAVDSVQNAADLAAAAQRRGVAARVLIEVDVGMGRCGTAPGEATVALARIIGDLEGISLAGLMGWEGHTVGITDQQEKQASIAASISALTSTADAVRAVGIPIDIVSCGGTGTYQMTTRQAGVTEIQAGGGILGDLMYRDRCQVDHEIALTVLATVVSRPNPRRIVCDSGKKTMSNDIAIPEPIGLPPVAGVKLSAEHGTIELKSDSRTPAVGDQVRFHPGYSDTTVFLHDRIYLIRGETVESVVPLLGRGKLQ